MSGHSRHQIIKRLQAELPRGAPFDLDMLETFGVSLKLAAHYAESGRLDDGTLLSLSPHG